MDTVARSSEGMPQRLKRLEREIWIHRAILALILCFAITVILMYSRRKEPETLSARRIVLKDEVGKARVVLKGDEGEPGMGVFDRSGQLVALLATIRGKGTLQFKDSKGTVRCALGLDRHFNRLSFFDSAGEGCAEMGAYPDGPAIMLGKDNSYNSIWVGIPDGRFSLAFRDGEDSVLYAVPPEIADWWQ